LIAIATLPNRHLLAVAPSPKVTEEDLLGLQHGYFDAIAPRKVTADAKDFFEDDDLSCVWNLRKEE